MTHSNQISIVKLDQDIEVLDAEDTVSSNRTFELGHANFEYVSHENAATQYLATLGSKTSVRTVQSKLNQIARWFHYPDCYHCDWHLMRYDNVINYIAYLKNTSIQTVTINAYLCAMKGVAQTAWNLGQISDHDLMRIKSIKQLRVSRKPSGKALTRRESKAFLAQCDGNSPHQIRDRAILLLLLGCGLRRAEITGIEMRNVFLDEGRIRLVGKGNKERDVYMNDTVSEAVIEWMDVREKSLLQQNALPECSSNKQEVNEGFLFGKWTRHYKRLIVDEPLNPWTVADIVRQYKSGAESLEKGLSQVTTHDLRRTFATRLLDKGIDISTVKNLMGHSNIATTTLYDKRGEDAMKRAAKEVDL